MAKPKQPQKDPNARVRKIGERTETIVTKLSQPQIDILRATVCQRLDQKEAIEERLKTIKSDYKAKMDALDEENAVDRRKASSGREEVEVLVEEFLTESNEVVKVRTDTGEQIGRRTANARELQEEMFADHPDGPPPDEGFPTDDAFGSDGS